MEGNIPAQGKRDAKSCLFREHQGGSMAGVEGIGAVAVAKVQ